MVRISEKSGLSEMISAGNGRSVLSLFKGRDLEDPQENGSGEDKKSRYSVVVSTETSGGVFR